jgi:hypothetical protein
MIYGLEQSDKYSPTNQEHSWVTDLHSHDPMAILNSKRAIRDSDAELSLDSTKIHAFYGLITKWLNLVKNKALLDRYGLGGTISTERYLGSYLEFLREGFDWLETREIELRERWHIFFLSQRESIPPNW